MGNSDSNKGSASAVKPAGVTAPGAAKNAARSKESLEKENEELRRVAQHRSLFLSRLAHELRTPLTSILGFAEILLTQEQLSEPQRSFCERIQSSAQQLQSSLNQLSDLSRLETGEAKLKCEEFSLVDLVESVFAALSRPAEKKSIGLSLQAADALPMVLSDRVRLNQSFYNLLMLAIRRSPFSGAVTVEIAQVENGFVVTITDRGDRLNEPSSLGTLELAERLDGSELALAIARQNIQVLGGALKARNRPEGLEIQIQLPLVCPRP